MKKNLKVIKAFDTMDEFYIAHCIHLRLLPIIDYITLDYSLTFKQEFLNNGHLPIQFEPLKTVTEKTLRKKFSHQNLYSFTWYTRNFFENNFQLFEEDPNIYIEDYLPELETDFQAVDVSILCNNDLVFTGSTDQNPKIQKRYFDHFARTIRNFFEKENRTFLCSKLNSSQRFSSIYIPTDKEYDEYLKGTFDMQKLTTLTTEKLKLTDSEVLDFISCTDYDSIKKVAGIIFLFKYEKIHEIILES